MFSFERTHAPEDRLVFIAMPFGNKDGYDFDRFYDGILLPRLRAMNLDPKRLDDIYGERNITQLIVQSIQRASIVVVDLSASSVNVGWELCLAMVYNKRCVFIAKQGSPIPTDLPNTRVLEYSATNDVFDMHAFEDQFVAQVSALLKEPVEEMGLVRYVGMTRVPATVMAVSPEFATVRTADGDIAFLTGSDIDYTRIYKDLTTRLKVGDHLSGGFIIDPGTQRSKYSLLKPEDNPWPSIASRFQLGTVFRGPVVNQTAAGAFIRVLGSVNGRVQKRSFPDGLPPVGTELEVVVSSLDITNRLIGLELQHPAAVPTPAKFPRVGELYEGVVVKVVPFSDEGRGGFVLLELEGFDRPALLLAKHMTPDLRADFDQGLLNREEIVTVEIANVDRQSGKVLLKDREEALSVPITD